MLQLSDKESAACGGKFRNYLPRLRSCDFHFLLFHVVLRQQEKVQTNLFGNEMTQT